VSTTNAIVTFPEVSFRVWLFLCSLFRPGSGRIPVALFQFQVRAAISALQYHRDLPRLPGNISVPDARNSDMLDLLHCVFGFQVSIWLTWCVNLCCLNFRWKLLV
jgi:hypothetical protein